MHYAGHIGCVRTACTLPGLMVGWASTIDDSYPPVWSTRSEEHSLIMMPATLGSWNIVAAAIPGRTECAGFYIT